MTNKLPLHIAVDITPTPPTSIELGDLQVGDFVKVATGIHGHGSEAFWVVLETVDDNKLSGIINNELKFTQHHGYASGQKIFFDISYVVNFIYQD
jgi:hypothetical protein